MAVKTNFLTNDFGEILSNYNLGEFVYSKPITKGTVQTNYIFSNHLLNATHGINLEQMTMFLILKKREKLYQSILNIGN